MALQTKTLIGNGSNGYHRFTLTVTEDSISARKSIGNYELTLSSIQTGWNWSSQGQNIAYNIKINNNSIDSGYITDYDGLNTITIASGTFEVAHDEVENDTNGLKTINISFSITDRDGEAYTCGAASASGTMTLTSISDGLVYIDNGTELEVYEAYIYNGTSWDRYIPYIDNGSDWDIYG